LGITRDNLLYQRIYGPLLDDAWAYFGVPSRDQKRLLQETELDFNAEFQNYESWGKG
jgi:hypothetical protein